MTGRPTQPQKDTCLLFTIDPSIIDLGQIHNGNISTLAGHWRGVIPNHQTKFWCIDVEAANETLEITTKLRKHKVDGPLTRNFSTNDWVLQYQHINTHFFTDTFFVTPKVKSI